MIKGDVRINFLFIADFFLILVGFFCVVSSFTTFRSNFTSGLLQVIYRDLGKKPHLKMIQLKTSTKIRYGPDSGRPDKDL